MTDTPPAPAPAASPAAEDEDTDAMAAAEAAWEALADLPRSFGDLDDAA